MNQQGRPPWDVPEVLNTVQTQFFCSRLWDRGRDDGLTAAKLGLHGTSGAERGDVQRTMEMDVERKLRWTPGQAHAGFSPAADGRANGATTGPRRSGGAGSKAQQQPPSEVSGNKGDIWAPGCTGDLGT